MSDDHLGSFLMALRGKMYCASCLGQMLAMRSEDVRSAVGHLRRAVTGFRRETVVCTACFQRCEVFGYVPESPSASPPCG
jgi:hypothetical protein